MQEIADWLTRLGLPEYAGEFAESVHGAGSASRRPQIILKTDQRTFILELGLGGKFQAKSSGWDENRTFLEGDVLEVAVRNGPMPHPGRAAPGPGAGPALFSDRGVMV
jgi:hypothetical protein